MQGERPRQRRERERRERAHPEEVLPAEECAERREVPVKIELPGEELLGAHLGQPEQSREPEEARESEPEPDPRDARESGRPPSSAAAGRERSRARAHCRQPETREVVSEHDESEPCRDPEHRAAGLSTRAQQAGQREGRQAERGVLRVCIAQPGVAEQIRMEHVEGGSRARAGGRRAGHLAHHGRDRERRERGQKRERSDTAAAHRTEQGAAQCGSSGKERRVKQEDRRAVARVEFARPRRRPLARPHCLRVLRRANQLEDPVVTLGKSGNDDREGGHARRDDRKPMTKYLSIE